MFALIFIANILSEEKQGNVFKTVLPVNVMK